MELSLSIFARKMKMFSPELHAEENIRCIRYIQLGERPKRANSHIAFVYQYHETKDAKNKPKQDETVICAVRNGYLLFRGYSLPIIFNELLKICWQYNEWESRLQDALCRDVPWQSIVDLLEELFQQPIMFFGPHGDLIGITETYKNSNVAPGWRSISMQKKVTLAFCESWAKDTMQVYPVIVEKQPPFKKVLQFGLMKRAPYAYPVYIIEWNEELDLSDVHLADAVQAAVSAVSYNFPAAQSLPEQLFIDLLEGKWIDEASTSWVIQQIWGEGEHHFHLAILQSIPHGTEKGLVLSNSLQYDFPDTVSFCWKDMVLLLFHVRQLPAVMEKLPIYLATYQYQGGISMRFRALQKLLLYFNQAKTCLAMCSELTPLVAAWAHSPKIVFNSCHQHCISLNILSPSYQILSKYDRENNTQLLKTLLVYFQQERNAATTAQILYVHRNTLLNRITKIQSLCSINMDDCNERMFFMLSCGDLSLW